MEIKGKKVVIRAICFDDLDILLKAINSEELEKYELRTNFPISYDDQKHWYEQQRNDSSGKKLVITYENKVIGYTNILNIDWVNRSAWTGIKIFSEEYRGMGLATDSVMAIMKYAFDSLNLMRLEGLIFEYNNQSKKLYIDRCGWKVEGIKRKCVYKNGEYYNAEYVSILRTEYYELIEKNNYWD